MALLALARGIAAGRYVLTSRSEIIQFTDRIQVKASTKPCATKSIRARSRRFSRKRHTGGQSKDCQRKWRASPCSATSWYWERPNLTKFALGSVNCWCQIAEPEGTSVVNEAATQISSIQYPKTNEKPEIVKSTTPKPLFEKFRYHFAGFLWSMKGPISLIVLFVITTPIILTSSDLNGPLARLGVTYGFLVLNILAILNNYAIVAATDRAWESLPWGPLLRDGQELTTFLALSTSSGMSGWIRILFTSPGVRHRQTAEDRRKRINKREGNPRMWSSGRYWSTRLSVTHI